MPSPVQPVDGFSLPSAPWIVEDTDSSRVVRTIPAGPARQYLPAQSYRAATGAEPVANLPRERAGQELRLRVVENAVVLPRNAALTAQGQLLRLNFSGGRLKDSVPKLAENRHEYRWPIAGSVSAGIALPVLVADSCWPKVYGHFLLEIVPQLAALPLIPRDSVVVTSAPLTPMLHAIFERLGVTAARIVPLTQAMLCAEAYWIDLPMRLGGNPHPIGLEIIERLKGSAAARPAGARRLFVSRAGVRLRRLREEAEVERLFETYGFTIVRPETLGIDDQIALFAAAEMIAGLDGSGMHNALFSPPETPVLIIQSRPQEVGVDAAISFAPRRLGFVMGTQLPASEDQVVHWTVNLDDVESGLRLHFGL